MGRRSAVDKWRERMSAAPFKALQNVTSLDGLLAVILGGELLPTQRRFLFDSVPEQEDRLIRVKGYMGPLGCAKTATICAAGLLRSLLIPGSRLLVSRMTYGTLETTVQARFLEQIYR